MISSETPYKLAEIIRDTWPGLYRLPEKRIYMNSNELNKNKIYDRTILLE
jgi:hypothetical protein